MFSAFKMYCKLNYLKSIKQFTVNFVLATACASTLANCYRMRRLR